MSRRRNKFGVAPKSRRTDADGTVFDSRGEMLRWGELQMLQKVGLIDSLERQVAYILEVPHCRTGRPVRISKYVADFRYKEGGKVVVEDFKSPATMSAGYRVKKALVYALHDVEIIETYARGRR